MDESVPIDEVIFQLQINLSDRFPALTPLALRKERARDVFGLIKRYHKFIQHEQKAKSHHGKKVIRRPAGDDWF